MVLISASKKTNPRFVESDFPFCLQPQCFQEDGRTALLQGGDSGSFDEFGKPRGSPPHRVSGIPFPLANPVVFPFAKFGYVNFPKYRNMAFQFELMIFVSKTFSCLVGGLCFLVLGTGDCSTFLLAWCFSSHEDVQVLFPP